MNAAGAAAHGGAAWRGGAGCRAGACWGLVRWGIAGLAVIGAHLALGQWLMQASRGIATAPPEAIFVDLEPAPEAAPDLPAAASDTMATPITDPVIPPSDLSLPPLPPQPTARPVADFAAPQLTELPPLTDFASLLPRQTLTASQRPTPRPQRRAEPDRQAQPSPATRPQPQPRAAPASQRQIVAPAAQPGAQPRAAPAAPGPQELARWQAQVGARIARHMARTRLPGGTGARVQVAVSIAGNGAASARLASSTGDAGTDAALARQASRMPSMPAPPGGQPQSFVLPIAVR